MARTYNLLIIGLIALAVNTVPQPANSQSKAIGVGWDANSAEEKFYSVDLSSGATTALGAIPNLELVVVGSHAVDAQTGVTLMVGSANSSTINSVYMVVPGSGLVFTFPLTNVNSRSGIVKSLIDSNSGEIYFIGTAGDGSTGQPSKGSFTVYKGAFDLLNASVTLSEVATFAADGLSLDGTGIAGGKLFVLNGPNLLTIDLTTTNQTSVPITPPLLYGGLFACDRDGSSSLNVLGSTSRSSSSYYSVGSDGTLDTILESPSISTYRSGSGNCTGGYPLLIAAGDDRSGGVVLRWYSGAPAPDFDSVVTNEPSLKYVAQVSDSATFSQSRSFSTSARSKNFRVLSKKITRCAVSQKQKKASFGKVVKRIAKLKSSAANCGKKR